MVVVAGDRMITASYPPIEFEHGIGKIKKITKSCMVLSAGDALALTDIFKSAKAAIKGLTEFDTKKIVEIIIKKYLNQKKRIANESILYQRGLTLDSVYGDKAKTLPPELIAHLDGMISKIGLSLDLLVCGIDANKGHLYTIKEGSPVDSLSQCYDSLGYSAIGSGALHAMSTFIYSGYLYNFPLNRAISVAYEAKKMAENAPGVGIETDVAIIHQDDIQYLGPEDIAKLDEIYKKKMIKREDPGNEKEMSYFNKFLPDKEKGK